MGKRKQLLPACIPRTRLQDGDLCAEIIEDRRSPRRLLCVVQKQGSPEILFLGQFFSYQEAESAAGDFMSEYQAHQHAQAQPANGGYR